MKKPSLIDFDPEWDVERPPMGWGGVLFWIAAAGISAYLFVFLIRVFS